MSLMRAISLVECQLRKLLVGQAQVEASVADMPEPLAVVSHKFSCPISNICYISEIQLADPSVEVFMEFHFPDQCTDSDRRNNLTISGSCVDISLHYMRYRSSCSIVEILSLSKNFMKSSTMYCGGRDTFSNHSGLFLWL
jgi:hypothetical protein